MFKGNYLPKIKPNALILPRYCKNTPKYCQQIMNKKQKPAATTAAGNTTTQTPKKNKTANSQGIWQAYKNWWLLAAVLLFSTMVLWRTLDGDFVNWDDDIYVTENPLLENLSSNLKTYFTQPIASNYHPLTILSLAIDYQLVGMNPWWYHVVNLVFHLLNTLLVYLFIKQLSRGKENVSLIVAVLFAIHPMHLESVAWISERKDVLFTFFFLLSSLSYMRYTHTGKVQHLAGSLGLFLLSCLSKPAAVTLAPTLVIIDWYMGRKFNQKAILDKIPYFIIALIFGIVTFIIQRDTAVSDFAAYTMFQRIMFASYGMVIYIIKLFVPYNLAVLHPYPNVPEGLTTFYYIAPLLVAALIAAVIWSVQKTKVVAFGFLYYLINVALVLQFMSVGMAIISERYTYVPYIGLFFILAMGFDYLRRQRPQLALPLTAIMVGYIVVMSVVTYNRTALWKNSDTLWTDVIKKYPNKAPVAHNNRGTYYRAEKQMQKALEDFNLAIQLLTDYQLAYVNRGNVYFSLNENEKALADYNKGLEIKKDDAKAFCNRAAVYFQLGQYEKAIEDGTNALKYKPIYPDAWMNRGVTYAVLGKHPEAIKDFTDYVAHQKDNPKIFNWRGISHVALKQYQQAIDDFNTAIKMKPDEGEFYYQRALAYNEMGNAALALPDVKKAKSLGYKVDEAFLQKLESGQ